MKIFGLELKFNGFDIWHKGNFDPNGKSDTNHTHDMSAVPTGNLSTTRLSEPNCVVGSVTKTAKPLFDVLRGDRTAFLPETQIIIEKSTDGGTTWVDAQIDDSTKRKLFTGQRPAVLIPLLNGVRSCNCMLRVTVTGMKYNVPVGTAETSKYNYWNSNYIQATERYFAPQDGWMWVTSVSDYIYLKVERATGVSPNNWVTDREAYLAGWSGGNYFSLSGNTFGGGTSQTSNYWNWRFTFRTCSTKYTFNDSDLSTSYNTSAQNISHIKLSGQNAWSIPNNYMYNEHLYTWDEYKNAIFPGSLKASTFLNSSGLEVSYVGHTHTKNDVTNMPTKLSDFQNDIGAGGGVKITTATTAPSSPSPGDFWYKVL